MRRIEKPSVNEYPPQAIRYIGLLPDDGCVLDHLERNLTRTREFLNSLPYEILTFRYAPAKWTVKEIVQHISDDERIYAYRALRFARGDATELPGFEQDAYALTSAANERTLDELLAELVTVRAATLTLYCGLADTSLKLGGVADGKYMSVRAIAYHIAGHEVRHLNVIRERYL